MFQQFSLFYSMKTFQNQLIRANYGNRTRNNCLEGSYDNHFTKFALLINLLFFIFFYIFFFISMYFFIYVYFSLCIFYLYFSVFFLPTYYPLEDFSTFSHLLLFTLLFFFLLQLHKTFFSFFIFFCLKIIFFFIFIFFCLQ